VTVARGLLGRLLVSEVRGTRTVGRIVEVEAYLGRTDPASHAFAGRRHPQNEGIYGPAGSWYVYRSYGVHWCANLVAGARGEGAAVLLRALEPIEGMELMRRRRGLGGRRLLCSGPGRLTEALAITRSLDRAVMPESPVYVQQVPDLDPAEVVASVRIGITRAADWPLRFTIRGSPWLSRPAGRK
jgi:DNA-3-methyladenine glycosylase